MIFAQDNFFKMIHQSSFLKRLKLFTGKNRNYGITTVASTSRMVPINSMHEQSRQKRAIVYATGGLRTRWQKSMSKITNEVRGKNYLQSSHSICAVLIQCTLCFQLLHQGLIQHELYGRIAYL